MTECPTRKQGNKKIKINMGESTGKILENALKMLKIVIEHYVGLILYGLKLAQGGCVTKRASLSSLLSTAT